MFVNDIFKKKQLDEGGPFRSTEPKKPRKGSVADLAAKKRKEQERGQQPVEPRDHMVGVARVRKDLAEGVMDQIKNIYMMLVSDTPMGTPESEFLGHWKRIIQDELGKNIDIDTLAKLSDNFTNRYKSMSRRGDVGDWHREMGHDLSEDSETHKYKVVVKGHKRSYSVWVEAKNEDVAIIRAQQYVSREHNDTAKRASVVDMKQGVAEGFDDLDRFMKAKYGPKPSGGSGIKRGNYGQPGRARGRKKGELSGAFHQGGGSDIPHNVDFDRSHSERSAGRRMPRFSDDYDSIKRSEVDEGSKSYLDSEPYTPPKDAQGKSYLDSKPYSPPKDSQGKSYLDFDPMKSQVDPNGKSYFDADIDEGSVQDKLHKRHQELRKKRGAPDPNYYKELKKTFDMPDDERWARTAELKKKYGVNEAKQQPAQVTSSWEVSFKDGKKKIMKAEHPKGSGPGNNSILATATVNNPTKQVASVKQINTPNAKTTKITKQDSRGFQWRDRDDSGRVGLKESDDCERYLEELGRAGYEIVTEAATLCPECGGVAYENRMLAEKQDACYHKVKSRYKVWPSAYASGALVRCRKKGAANWGNKSKK